MIQKLEQSVIGTDYGCGGASFSEVIDKVNEVIDYINSRPEEKPSEDLEEAADRYASDSTGFIDMTAYSAFIAGAELQRKQDEHLIWRIAEKNFEGGKEAMKEQMMKDAIEGVVYRYKSHKRIATAIVVDIPRETLGNRVKLIIVE